MAGAKVNHRLMRMLARDYRRLYGLCRGMAPRYGREEFEDIFHECLLFAATDPRLSGVSDPAEAADAFCYRFRMIEFGHYKTKKQKRETSYADYLQAKESEEE